MTVQISFMSEGGSDTPTPDLSIEVDDLNTVLERMQAAGFPIEYGPAEEPWGVRRFYVRDPFGKLVNILTFSLSVKLPYTSYEALKLPFAKPTGTDMRGIVVMSANDPKRTLASSFRRRNKSWRGLGSLE